MQAKLRRITIFAILQGVTPATFPNENLKGRVESERQETTTPQVPSSTKEGMEDKNPSPDKNRGLPLEKGELPNWSAWQLAWELGYTIAIPIVVLALVGRWADKAWGTSPWMLLAGVVISVVISSALVYRKVKKIL